MKEKYSALVLQGGGALGAYEYGVVKALYERNGFSPNIITGVSIGAISAAVLAGAKDGPVKGLGRLWKALMVADIPFVSDQLMSKLPLLCNPAMYVPNLNLYLDPNSATSVSDTWPLYCTLDRLIDRDKLNSKTAPNLVVAATNIATGMIEEFDNRKMRITFKHIVASGSLPPSFPMTKVGENYYWDGGLFSNTPLGPAFNRLEELGNENSEREIILVELFPQMGSVPRNLTEVCGRMTQMAFERKMEYDSGQWERITNYIDMIHEIDKELPATSKVRHSPGFRKLMGYKKIHKLTVIKHSEPEPLTAAADFTRKSIERRIAQGYRDAKKQLGK